MTKQDAGVALGGRLPARKGRMAGIVIRNGPDDGGDGRSPRIAAFIWGGKVKPTPTLPYGRWKDLA